MLTVLYRFSTLHHCSTIRFEGKLREAKRLLKGGNNKNPAKMAMERNEALAACTAPRTFWTGIERARLPTSEMIQQLQQATLTDASDFTSVREFRGPGVSAFVDEFGTQDGCLLRLAELVRSPTLGCYARATKYQPVHVATPSSMACFAGKLYEPTLLSGWYKLVQYHPVIAAPIQGTAMVHCVFLPTP